ncbi:MAG: amidohydrolase family protein [Lachnospiraceae bacterium]
MKKIIKNGMLCTESGVYEADLLLEEGVIREIGTDLQDSGAEVVDAKGKYVLPGAVDIHTHMDLDVGIARVIDDFYTGTIAAACGGTTSIVDHMAFGPQNCSLWHQVKEYHRLADGNAVVDYGFHGVFQHVNPQVLEEMGEIAKEEGITSFKVYMTYGYGLGDSDLMQILTRAKQDGILIASHCENDGIVNYWREKFVKEGHTQAKYHPISRPAVAEAEAVNRFLYLAESAGEAPVYVVHLSSKQGLMEVRRAKRRGQKHFGVETCPQYLFMTDDRYTDDQEGLKAIMAPPLRRKEDNEALWQALESGELDAVATRSLPVYVRKAEAAGRERLYPVSERSTWCGGTPPADVLRGSEGRASDHSAGGTLPVHKSGKDRRTVSEEGNNPDRFRCRPGSH